MMTMVSTFSSSHTCFYIKFNDFSLNVQIDLSKFYMGRNWILWIWSPWSSLQLGHFWPPDFISFITILTRGGLLFKMHRFIFRFIKWNTAFWVFYECKIDSRELHGDLIIEDRSPRCFTSFKLILYVCNLFQINPAVTIHQFLTCQRMCHFLSPIRPLFYY